jgi:hypothetical protein
MADGNRFGRNPQNETFSTFNLAQEVVFGPQNREIFNEKH